MATTLVFMSSPLRRTRLFSLRACVHRQNRAQLSAQFGENLSKLKLEAIRVKNAGAAVDVGGEVVKMILAVIMGSRRHRLSLA